MNDRDRVIVKKMLGYCEEVLKTHDFFSRDKALFMDRERGFVYRNAITMPILQLGELAKNLSGDFRSRHSHVPWKDITGIRDIFAHRYGTIDFELVWSGSVDDIAALKKDFQAILGQDE